MCGIVGKITAGSNVPPELITRMNGCAVHRGPDDSGVFIDGNIGFGHRRLSILDPSQAGHQPMATSDRRYWIVYNGEIYNFWEIRSELERKGHRFETRSDTETVLAAFGQGVQVPANGRQNAVNIQETGARSLKNQGPRRV